MQHVVNKALTPWVAANRISGHLVHAVSHRHRTTGHNQGRSRAPKAADVYTYCFSSYFPPKFKVMRFQNGDIKLHTVILLFLCFLRILTKLCCRWSRSRRSTF